MMKVKVHKWQLWDISKDEYVHSTRMATEEAIASAGGSIVPGTAVEIDAADLDHEAPFEGMTPKGYQPPK